MTRGRKGFVLIILGVVAIVAGMGFLLASIFPIIGQFKQVIVHESPGDLQFSIEEAGEYSVWHDYKTVHHGRSVVHPKALPPGFTIKLIAGDSSVLPLNPSSINETLSLESRESYALGTFEVTTPGTYYFHASNPAGDERIFSLTKGTFLGSMWQFGLRLVLGVCGGLIGFILLIVGIVLMVTKPKAGPAPPPPPVQT